MKKVKKQDLKKLALMGITGGVMCASQVSAAIDLNSSAGHILASGCGGKHGCGHNTAYQPHGCGNSSQPQVYYYDQGAPGAPPSSGCGGNRPPSVQPQPYGQPPSSGCGGNRPPAGQPQPYYSAGQMPTSGCGGNRPPSAQPQAYYSTNQIPSSGCGGNRPPSGQPQPPSQPPSYYLSDNQGYPTNSGSKGSNSGQPSQGQRSYSQWETNGNIADSSRNNSGGSNQSYTAKQAPLTESQLLSQLNDQGKALYQSLDSDGKALALKLASQTCKGQNDCKGLNSCKNSEHACAGQGSCKGTSVGPFKDKNQAVKIAAQKMAEKRSKSNSGKY